MAVLTSADLVSYWSLEESSGTRLDAHAGNDLSVGNGTPAAATGIQGNGIDLEASSSEYLAITDAAQSGLEPATFTISCWIKLESLPSVTGNMHVIAKWDTKAYRIRLSSSSDRLIFEVSSDGTTTEGQVSGTTFGALSAGVWYHVVAVVDGTNNYTYINTTSQSTSYSNGIDDNAAGVALGSVSATGGGSAHFDGIIDELSFWNVAADSADVATLYNSGSGLDYAGTVAAFSSDIDLTPSPSTVQVSATNPDVLLGSVSITPSVASAQVAATNPNIVISITAGEATVQVSGTNPQIILGNATITPDEALVQVGSTNPNILLGSVSTTPAESVVQVSATNPNILLGSISVTPTDADVQVAATDATVVVAEPESITADPSTVQVSATNPDVLLGSISITPTESTVQVGADDPIINIAAPIDNSFFNGRIDETSAWARTLEDFEVFYLWNSGAGRNYEQSTALDTATQTSGETGRELLRVYKDIKPASATPSQAEIDAAALLLYEKTVRDIQEAEARNDYACEAIFPELLEDEAIDAPLTSQQIQISSSVSEIVYDARSHQYTRQTVFDLNDNLRILSRTVDFSNNFERYKFDLSGNKYQFELDQSIQLFKMIEARTEEITESAAAVLPVLLSTSDTSVNHVSVGPDDQVGTRFAKRFANVMPTPPAAAERVAYGISITSGYEYIKTAQEPSLAQEELALIVFPLTGDWTPADDCTVTVTWLFWALP